MKRARESHRVGKRVREACGLLYRWKFCIISSQGVAAASRILLLENFYNNPLIGIKSAERSKGVERLGWMPE